MGKYPLIRSVKTWEWETHLEVDPALASVSADGVFLRPSLSGTFADGGPEQRQLLAFGLLCSV